MLPSVPLSNQGSKAQRELIKLFSKLDKAGQQQLLLFAEFLCEKTNTQQQNSEQSKLIEPDIIPRPESETVIGAIKRLSKSYSMVDRDDVLHETSDLMSSHVIKGRPASEVIDDLEVLFLKEYTKIIQNSAVNKID